jgi:hypothetical protein
MEVGEMPMEVGEVPMEVGEVPMEVGEVPMEVGEDLLVAMFFCCMLSYGGEDVVESTSLLGPYFAL